MFTGIIEDLGIVKDLVIENDNLHLTIESVLAPELKIDQSVSHNGVCLTVIALTEHRSEERRVGKECRSRWSPYH